MMQDLTAVCTISYLLNGDVDCRKCHGAAEIVEIHLPHPRGWFAVAAPLSDWLIPMTDTPRFVQLAVQHLDRVTLTSTTSTKYIEIGISSHCIKEL